MNYCCSCKGTADTACDQCGIHYYCKGIFFKFSFLKLLNTNFILILECFTKYHSKGPFAEHTSMPLDLKQFYGHRLLEMAEDGMRKKNNTKTIIN